jgi:hypothetical protein
LVRQEQRIAQLPVDDNILLPFTEAGIEDRERKHLLGPDAKQKVGNLDCERRE